jgi:hypothetical protein
MNTHTDFDSAKFYLGQLCKRNHSWSGTNQSLRLLMNRECETCRRDNARNRRKRERRTDFDTTKYYLGQLCQKFHEYKDTNQSLRYKSNRACVSCKKDRYEKTNFDLEKFYLGQLCTKNHNWDRTKRSLRRKSTGKCLVCERNSSRYKTRSVVREMLKSARRRSRKEGWEIDINEDFIKSLNERQEGRCIYTNAVLEWDRIPNQGRIDNRASIDRIDSKKGYTTDNVQLVTDRINWAKGDLAHSKFLELCKTVTERFQDTDK